MEQEKEVKVADISFEFALQIIKLSRDLVNNKEYILSKQIMRSGTSIGANIEEANSGHSKKDFLAKMIIALKECRETKYWLRLLKGSAVIEFNHEAYFKTADDIFNILTRIVLSTKRNLGIPLRIYFFFFSLFYNSLSQNNFLLKIH